MERNRLEAAMELAARAAEAPARGLLAAFRDPELAVETKADGSPVTAADRAAEAEVRRVLRTSAHFGALEILGEETGLERGAGAWRWVVDPIDGTISFTRGLPAFATIVALEERDTQLALAGAIHLPCANETYRAARGLGAWCGTSRLSVSKEADLRRALISLPDPAQFRRTGTSEAHHVLWEASDFARGYCDAWAHAMVARGALDAMLDPGLHDWDVRASQVLIEEAGGLFLTRPSHREGAVDALFGAPRLVEEIAARVGF